MVISIQATRVWLVKNIFGQFLNIFVEIFVEIYKYVDVKLMINYMAINGE